MFHKVVVIGNLGRDPEMRYTPSGVPVVDFSVASTRRWKKQDGTTDTETIWFRCTAWRELAERINQYLHKGSKVYIEGRLNPDANGSPRVWPKKDGSYGASYELTVETVKFLDSRGVGTAEGPDAIDVGEEALPGIPEDDIPF